MAIDDKNYCGCCGRECAAEWCRDCRPHLGGDDHTAPYERTYFAQHGEPCPFEDGPNGGGTRMAA